jgi:ribosome biogenesis ATPase
LSVSYLLVGRAVAGELGVPLVKIAATEIVSGVSGESEERLREVFNTALEAAPCVLFIDEIDAISTKRETAGKEMERRIVAQLVSCLDDMASHRNGQRVVVVGATSRPDALDPGLRRGGRFDREISLGIPDAKSRVQILKILCKDLKLAEDFDYDDTARQTPGFVGADLAALTREAAMVAVDRCFSQIEKGECS